MFSWLAAQVRVALSPARQVSAFVSEPCGIGHHCGFSASQVAVQELCPLVRQELRSRLDGSCLMVSYTEDSHAQSRFPG